MNLEFDLNAFKTPYYIVDESLIIKNLKILKAVKEESGCKILLAQKAFSMYYFYPLIKKFLDGTTASGLFEAKLGFEEMGGETHIFSAAYFDDEFSEILKICGHIVFNSFNQWERFKRQALKTDKKFGMRINPQCSTQEHAIYDPSAFGSRLGVTFENFKNKDISGISGLHFHNLCEQNSDALEETLKAVEEKFGEYLYKMEWVNFGGGHHITRDDYDVSRLIELIKDFKARYDVEVYLEPGEAVALNTGFLVSTVLDIVKNDINTAVLDTSAACHMPDVLEMPYRPYVINSDFPDIKKYTYRFGGPTCLAGDIIGDYSFNEPLKEGDKVVFTDMAHYTMVKNNTFNGMRLPSIAVLKKDKTTELIKTFGYDDFKQRL